jgi:Ca2+-binding RTX toxin-like protein
MLLETLENRRLLSASLDATSGLLTINGTDYADRVNVFQYNAEIVVTQSTYVPATASTPARVVSHRWEFDATQVKSILANAGGGSDYVNVGGYVYPLPVASIGSSLPVITLLSIPSTVYGGGGNDYLYGGNGKDQLNGGGGRDHLYGRGGDDILNGNDGNDYLNGGRGADQLNGGSGNDYIYAVDGAATDKIDGGTNNTPTATSLGDVAVIDKGDSTTNVEKVIIGPTPLPT